MKLLVTILFSFLFLVCAPAQTRNVIVGTNSIIVQPTNFWSADASNARTKLGLGWSALTNSNAAASLLGFTTNGTVVANTGTNTLRFANDVSFSGGPIVNGSGIFYVTMTNGGLDFEAEALIDGSNNTVLNWGNPTILSVDRPLGFTTNNAATTRTNLGLGATWLTNTNAANFRTNLGLGLAALTNTNTSNFRSDMGLGWSALTNTNAGTSLVSVNTNGEVVSPTNFWQQAPIATTVAFSAPSTNSTNTATNSRNLIIQSLSSNIVGTTNTLLLPTNTSTFNGDTALVIHAGGSGSATAIRQAGQTSNLIVLTNFDHAVRFLYFNNAWDFYHNIAFVEPIYFSGTNAAAHVATTRTNIGLGGSNDVEFKSIKTAGVGSATNLDIQFDGNGSGIFGNTNTNTIGITILSNNVAFFTATNVTFYQAMAFNGTAGASRTNLGIPYTALTNSNNTNFQAAVFNTNSTPNGSAFNTIVAWMEVNVVTNGVNTSFRIPLFK
jgi:hypothetical protein